MRSTAIFCHFLRDPQQYFPFSARSTAIILIFCAIHRNICHFLRGPPQYLSLSARFTTLFLIFCAIHRNICHILCDPQQYFWLSARSTAISCIFCAIHNHIFSFSVRSTTIFFLFCAIHSNMFHFLCDPEHPRACSTLNTLWHLGGQGYTSEKHPGKHQKSQSRLPSICWRPRQRKKSQGYIKSRKVDYRRIFGALDIGDFRVSGQIVLEHK